LRDILTSMDKKRKRKSLKLKVEHLKLELEDRKEEASKLEQQFLEELSRIEVEEIPHAPQKPLPTEAPPRVEVIGDEGVKEDLPTDDVPERPEEFRKMWKAIAAVTHPDRTGDDPEKTELYKRAAAAWSKGDHAELLSVAMDLGISPPEDSELGLRVLEETATDLEKQIAATESSVLWTWAAAPPEKKQQIIDLYLGSRGKKRRRPPP